MSSPASSLTPSTTASRSSSPAKTITTVPVLPPGVEDRAWSQQDSYSPLVQDNINRLAVNLYSELLNRLVSYINRSIQPRTKQFASMILFDCPGFQNPCLVGTYKNKILPGSYSCLSGDRPSAGFVDLCYNYLQERIQMMFFSSPLERLSERDRNVAKVLSSMIIATY